MVHCLFSYDLSRHRRHHPPILPNMDENMYALWKIQYRFSDLHNNLHIVVIFCSWKCKYQHNMQLKRKYKSTGWCTMLCPKQKGCHFAVKYHQTSNISYTLVGSKIIDPSCACWRCSNYNFVLDWTHGFNGLGKDNCKMKRETFKFGDLIRFILEVWL